MAEARAWDASVCNKNWTSTRVAATTQPPWFTEMVGKRSSPRQILLNTDGHSGDEVPLPPKITIT